MPATLAAVLAVLTVVVILAVIHVPLGSWIHRVFTSPTHTRVERLIYRLTGVDPDAEQRWGVYAVSVLAFSGVSILLLWGLIVAQPLLPFSQGRAMNVDTALNTARRRNRCAMDVMNALETRRESRQEESMEISPAGW